MTSFRLVDTASEGVSSALRAMETASPMSRAILNRSQVILTEPALVYDSVMVFAKGLERALAEGPELFLRFVEILGFFVFARWEIGRVRNSVNRFFFHMLHMLDNSERERVLFLVLF